MKKEYNTNDESAEQLKVNEASPVYQIQEHSVEEAVSQVEKTMEDKLIVPDYVWDDLRIGLEQYEKGECISVDNLLKRIKFGV